MAKMIKIILIVSGILLLLSPFFILKQIIFPDILGKATLIQAIAALSLPMLLPALWADRKIIFSLRQPLVLAVLAYSAILILTAVMGIDPYQSFWGTENRGAGVFNFLHILAAFFIFLLVLRDEIWRRRYALAAVVFGCFISAAAVFQFLTEAGTRTDRFLGNPILLGGYLLFPLFISLTSVFAHKGYKRYIFTGATALIFAALLTSQTRGAFLGALGGGIFCLAAVLFFSGRERRKGILAKSGMVLAGAAILFTIFYVSGNVQVRGLVSRFSNFSPSGSSANQRIIMYKMAWRAAGARPLLGWGPENFDYAFDKEYNPQLLRYGVSETWSDRAHNVYLDALVMGGLIGLAAYLAVFTMAFWVIYKSIKARTLSVDEGVVIGGLLSAYGIANFFAFDSPASVVYFVFILAYIGALALPKNEGGRKYSLIAVFLGIVLVISILPSVIRNAQAGKKVLSASYLPPAAAAETLKLFDEAFAIRPKLIREFRLRFANLAFEQAENMSKEDAKWLLGVAIEEIKKNIEVAPHNFSYRYELGNLYLERGILFGGNDFLLADEAYASAEEYSPKRQALFFQWASTKYLMGDMDSAIALFEKAVEADPEVGQPHWRLGLAYAYKGEDVQAISEWRRALYKGEKISYILNSEGAEISGLHFVPTLSKERIFVANTALRALDYDLLRTIILVSLSQEETKLDWYAKLAAVELELGNYEASREAVRWLVKTNQDAAAEAAAFLEEINRRENASKN